MIVMGRVRSIRRNRRRRPKKELAPNSFCYWRSKAMGNKHKWKFDIITHMLNCKRCPASRHETPKERRARHTLMVLDAKGLKT